MMLPDGLPPEVFEHEVIPADPVTSKIRLPEGATAPMLPVTVAVKIKDPPKTGAPETLRFTEGVALETVVVVEEAVAATEL